MRIMAIALGGCLTAEPSYGITEDTGGHITYILGAMRALAERQDVHSAEIVTRRFEAPELGAIYSQPREQIAPKLSITRIDSGDARYLSKEALAADRTAFTQALIAELRRRDTLPDVIHAHFADAAQIAKAVRDSLGIPFIYTAHSLGIDKAEAFQSSDSDLANRIAEESAAMAGADAIIGSSRDECERQLPAYDSAPLAKIHRVRPGIDHRSASPDDIKRAHQLIEPFLRDAYKPIILAIARPVRKKNLIALVEAYAASRTLQDRANLVILPGLRESFTQGENEQVQVLRELADAIDRNDLYGKVAYPRRHSQGQVRGMYTLARQSGGVFVNPALVEPFGLTILEAAAHGLPVVATCNGGPVDILEELQHGLLVDPADTGAIAGAIECIIGDLDLQVSLSDKARRNIAKVQWSEYAAGFVQIARTLTTSVSPVRQVRKIERLLLCDIDNTLTGCRDSAHRFREYLASQPTTLFGVATGRSLIEARRVLREWNLPVPSVWITSVGSEIYWDSNGDLVPDAAYAAKIDHDWQPDRIEGLAANVGDLTPQPRTEQRTFKRSYFAPPQGLDALSEALAGADISARVIFSHERLLDVLPERAGKGAAMRHVAAQLGLSPERVIVAGDSGNDLDMIEACDNSIIVGNCEPALRALEGKPNIYLASHSNAAGVLEGLQMLGTPGSRSLPNRSVGEAA